MAQNEMKAKPAPPERVRSMEGLGVGFASVQWLRALPAVPRTLVIVLDDQDFDLVSADTVDDGVWEDAWFCSVGSCGPNV